MNPSEIKEIILQINGTQAEEEIKKLKGIIEGTRQAKERFEQNRPDSTKWTKAQRQEWEGFNKVIAQAEQKIRKYGLTADAVEQVLANLNGATMKDLKANLKVLNNTLNSRELIRGSENWKKVTEAIRLTKEEMKRITDETKVVEKAMVECTEKPVKGISEFGQKWGGFASIVTATLNVYDHLMGKASQYINIYADLSEHISGVIKYTGMGAEAAAELNEEFKKMDTRTSRAALNDLAADAGRLGISGKKDVLDFVQAADQINVALGADLGEGAIKNIGKLATLFGDDKKMGLKQAMLSTASAVNDLAQSSSASEGYIVEFTGRLAGAAAQAGMTQAQVMGLASVFDQAMINAEESSTALSKILIKMYKDPAAMARAAGLDVKKFTDTLRNDANAALIEFAKGVQNMGGLESVAPMLADLKLQGAGVSKMLLTLANDTQKVTDTQAQAAAAFAEGTSVTNEFNAANSTAQAQLEKARNALNGVYAEIGEKLYPAFIAGTNAAVAFMKAASGFITVISKLKLTIVALSATLAIATLRQKAFTQDTVLGTRVMALQRMGFSKLGVSIGIMHKGLKAVFTSITAFARANPIGLIITGVTLLIETLDFFKNKSREAAEAQREREEADLNLANAEKKVAEETSQQIARVKRLSEMILDNTRAQKNRLWAINELRKIIPDYNGKLGDEKKLTEDTTTAVNNYIDALKRMARQKVISNMVGEIDSQIVVNELSRDRRQTGVTTRTNRLNKFLNEEEGMKQYAADINAGVSKADAQNRLHKTIYGTDEYTTKSTTHVLELIARYNELRSSLREMQDLLDESNKTLGRLNQNREMLLKGAERMGIKREEIEQANAGLTDLVKQGKTRYVSPADEKEEKKKREAAFSRLEKEYRDAAQKIMAAYADGLENGTMTEDAYYRKMLAAAEDFKSKSVKVAGAAAKEKEKAEKKGNDVIKQINDEHRRSLLAREEANYKAQQDKLNFYLETNQISQKEYNGQNESLLLMHQQNRLAIVKKYATDEKQVVEELQSLQEANTKRAAGGIDELKKLLKEITAAEAKRTEGSKTYEQQLAALNKAEEFAIKLVKANAAALEDVDKTIERVKKHFEALRGELNKNAKVKLDIKELDANKDFGFSKLIKAIKKFNKKAEGEMEDSWENIAETVVAALGMITSTLNAASQLFQANCELETAKVEQEYDNRIAAAEGNEELQQQLEEEKNAKIAAIKAKYAEKEFKAKIITAIADIAKNAILAYQAAGGNPWLGAAFAAMVTAAGMVQLAVIKKQYEAQKATGFYTGGYTGGSDYKKPAGIVHEGEYVLPHEAVNNPAVSPFLDIIETARRSNRLASLTPEDVSRAVTAPQAAAAMAGRTAAAALSTAAAAARTANNTAAPVVTIKGGDQTAAAVRRLNRKLDEGIESYVVLSGPQGLDSQWRRYQRLTGK